MWEDAAIECELFAARQNVFSIASAGCTALALARRQCHVVACDINPVQVAYVRRRACGGPVLKGRADRFVGLFQAAASGVGISHRTRRTFLELDDVALQLSYWQKHFDRPWLRRLLRWALSLRGLRSKYGPNFVHALPNPFEEVLWRRLTRGFGMHLNRENPFAWRLLVGMDKTSETVNSAGDLKTVCADACDYLEACDGESFDGFTLSNILDGATRDYAERLACALRRAARRQAVVVLRSFAEPHSSREDVLAACDRSMLWGRIIACRARDFDLEYLN
jgi:S-adenosylmethionine:diacylglycerol 3-amino-3-carboxypropyl transferase